ncbi:MAG: TetR/AcrR family transcriptional regulator [Hyphomicrobiales bacterium]|jgi:AcrR family transcriptional regulator|nr:TetR/AcrR family transcriptional regulator [Hyphomicrobiales bacterium]
MKNKARSGTTRDALISATRTAIQELGIARVTTRRIAGLAGVSEATLFNHFSTKDELVLAVLADWAKRGAIPKDRKGRQEASIEKDLGRIATAADRYYDMTLNSLIAASADKATLPRHLNWLFLNAPETGLADEVRLIVEGCGSGQASIRRSPRTSYLDCACAESSLASLPASQGVRRSPMLQAS